MRGAVGVLAGLWSALLPGSRFRRERARVPGEEYPDAKTIASRLEKAAGSSNGLVRIETIGKNAAQQSLSVVRIGTGDPASPAVLVVAGLDGRHLHGIELALRHIEAFAADPKHARDVLDGGTLYVVPTLLPYASQSVTQRPARERATAPGAGDLDKDMERNEDMADDLDGDDVLRWVRVADSGGAYRTEEAEPGILHPADRNAGESGAWRLLTEGLDDDGDRRWNEEMDGGVLLAQNFPFRYEWFARNTGAHQVSEPETRALMDFVVMHPEIGIVLTYGFEDNLLQPWPEQKSSDPSLTGPGWGRKPVEAPNKNDLPIFREFSDRYLEAVGLSDAKGGLGVGGFVTDVRAEDELPIPAADDAAKGGFAASAYFHRGLVALSTPVWTPGVQLARLDAAEAAAKKAGGKDAKDGKNEREDGGKGDEDGGAADGGAGDGADGAANATADDASAPADSGDEATSTAGRDAPTADADADADDAAKELPKSVKDEARYLAWLREVDPAAWKDWAPFDHPDFPGRQVEVGGYAPLARIVPPLSVLDETFAGHQTFLEGLFAARPEIVLLSASLTEREGGVYALEFETQNVGYVPDVLAQGVFSRIVRPTRFEITLPKGAEMLGGTTRGPLERLRGEGTAVRTTRLLRLPGKEGVEVTVIAQHGGSDSRRVTPGENWRRP
ncbi:MAG: M14 family zinc carboxypeptidase [Candidatus Eisenbacteria bacterium]